MTPWAEVIGDPIGHSLSPVIHGYWLEVLGLAGRYQAGRVAADGLLSFLRARSADPHWRGCNVTAPHKEAVLPLLDRVDRTALAVGAVNCIHRDGQRLAGTNTDADGIAEALSAVSVRGGKVVIIGGGGAARAAIHYLREQRPGEILLVLRRPEAASALGGGIAAVPASKAHRAFASASLIINATPLGLAGGEAMPPDLVAAVRGSGAAAAFDMIYRPLTTRFLAAAEEGGAVTIDGLAMLLGQARRAFTLFFGADPPRATDAELRRRLRKAQP